MVKKIHQSLSQEMRTIRHKEVTLKESKLTPSEVITAGANQQHTFKPTPGTIGRVKSVGFYAPAISASTSNHRSAIGIGTAYGAVERLAWNDLAGTSAINFYPYNNSVALVGATFTEAMPLVITYLNDTNLSQTGARQIRVVWEEELL